MKIGVCTSIDNASILAEAGFDYIEENVQTLLVPEEPEEVFGPKLEAVKKAALPTLAANCFLPGTIKSTGPDLDEERIIRYAERTFRRAQQAGIRFIVYGSAAARQIPEGCAWTLGWNQMLGTLRRIAPTAKRCGVVIVLEPLNRKECNLLNSLSEGVYMVQGCLDPNVRLLADFYHMAVENEDPREIVPQVRWLQHVHVAEKEGRFAPGTGGQDFGPYLRALKEIDYKGAISFECNWKDLPAQAANSLKSFREQVKAAGLE